MSTIDRLKVKLQHLEEDFFVPMDFSDLKNLSTLDFSDEEAMNAIRTVIAARENILEAKVKLLESIAEVICETREKTLQEIMQG